MAPTPASLESVSSTLVTDLGKVRAQRARQQLVRERHDAVVAEISQRGRLRALANYLEVDPMIMAAGLVEALEREATPRVHDARFKHAS